MAERKLGRGLDGLMQAAPGEPMPEITAVVAPQVPTTTLPLTLLDPNPFQPRQNMAPEELEHLKASILEHGVLQPIVVRRHGERYQIIAGERRFRASQAAGLAEAPVIVRDVPDEQMLELALIENLQREDLDPMEKATSFRAYMDRFDITQERASVRLGIDRSTIANIVRLLDLPEEVQTLVRQGMVTMGHARAILSIESPKKQVEVAARVAREDLSVRQVERIAKATGPTKRRGKAGGKAAHVRDLESRFREALGTKVTLEEGGKPGSGRIVIEFYNHDDLDRILAKLS